MKPDVHAVSHSKEKETMYTSAFDIYIYISTRRETSLFPFCGMKCMRSNSILHWHLQPNAIHLELCGLLVKLHGHKLFTRHL